MKPHLLFGAVALAVFSSTPVLAQARLTVGQPAQGALSAADPKLSDGSHFDCWLFDAPGGTLTVDLRSSAFDTVLMAGRGANCGDNGDSAVVNDDGPNMGTDSRVVLTGARGPYWIVVNTYGAGETGAYSLSVSESRAGGQPSNRGGPVLPSVESEWGVEPLTCHAAYSAMERIGAEGVDLSGHGNVGRIDYRTRARAMAVRMPSGQETRSRVFTDNFVAMASWGSLGRTPTGADNGHRPLAEYLTAVADCDRAFEFEPVTRFN